jgi:hypothetical protein
MEVVVAVVVTVPWSGDFLQNVFLQQQMQATTHTMMTTREPTVIATDAVTPRDRNRVRKLLSVK